MDLAFSEVLLFCCVISFKFFIVNFKLILDIYLLTAIGFPPGGSSTVHIYTQTIHRTTQNKQYIEQHKHFGRVWAVPRLCGLYPGICLTVEEKARKTPSQESRRVPAGTMNTHKHTYIPLCCNNLIYKDECLFVCMELIQIHISEPIGSKLCTRLPLCLEEVVGYVWTHNISTFPHFRPILSGASADSCAEDGCPRQSPPLLRYIPCWCDVTDVTCTVLNA